MHHILDWEGATESIVTASTPTTELDKFVILPLSIPKIPCHTQSCERAVKKVTRAAASIFGAERRDGFI